MSLQEQKQKLIKKRNQLMLFAINALKVHNKTGDALTQIVGRRDIKQAMEVNAQIIQLCEMEKDLLELSTRR